MAGGGGQGEWSTHIRMYMFKWFCSALEFAFDDLLHVLRLDECDAH